MQIKPILRGASLAFAIAAVVVAAACQTRQNITVDEAEALLSAYGENVHVSIPQSPAEKTKQAAEKIRTIPPLVDDAKKHFSSAHYAEPKDCQEMTNAEWSKGMANLDQIGNIGRQTAPVIFDGAKDDANCHKENTNLKDAPVAAARNAQAQGFSAGIKFSVFLGGLAVLAGITSFLPWTAPFVPFVVPEVLGAAAVLVFVAVSALAEYFKQAKEIAAVCAILALAYFACRFWIRHKCGHYFDAAKSHLVVSIGGAWLAVKTWANNTWIVCLTWCKTAWPIIQKDASELKNWSAKEIQQVKDKAEALKGKAAILESKVADAIKKV